MISMSSLSDIAWVCVCVCVCVLSLYLEIADVLEHEGVVDVDGLADLVVHGVDVRLVHGHALLGQRGRIVDGDVMELGVVLPVLV